METIFWIFLIICTGFTTWVIIDKNISEKEYYKKSIEVKKLELELLNRKLL